MSPDQPIGLLQYLQDVLPLGVCKRARGGRDCGFVICFNSVSARRNMDSGDRTTARSMTFCSSRMFPGQSCALRTSITSSGITSMGLLKRAENLFTKYFTSAGISRVRSRNGGREIGMTFNR